MIAQETFAERLHMSLTRLAAEKDIKGSQHNEDCTYLVMFNYFHGRKQREWDVRTMKRLLPLLRSNTSCLSARRRDISLGFSLVLKSVLAYMSYDFPVLADVLLYSPLMQQIDDVLETWNEKNPTLIEFHCVLSARNNKPSDLTAANHNWWNLLEEAENRVLLPHKLAVLNADVKKRKQHELDKMETMNMDTLKELKKQHENAEKARLYFQIWALSYLLFKKRFGEISEKSEAERKSDKMTRENYKLALAEAKLNREDEEAHFDRMSSVDR